MKNLRKEILAVLKNLFFVLRSRHLVDVLLLTFDAQNVMLALVDVSGENTANHLRVLIDAEMESGPLTSDPTYLKDTKEVEDSVSALLKEYSLSTGRYR